MFLSILIIYVIGVIIIGGSRKTEPPNRQNQLKIPKVGNELKKG